MGNAVYIVQPGDSLSLISKRFFNDFSQVDAIALANNITNKNLIVPGQRLILPGVEEAEVIETTSGSSNWWKWLLGAAVVGGGAWWYYNKNKKTKSLNGNASSDDLFIKRVKKGLQITKRKGTGEISLTSFADAISDKDMDLDFEVTGHGMVVDQNNKKVYGLTDHYIDRLEDLNSKGRVLLPTQKGLKPSDFEK